MKFKEKILELTAEYENIKLKGAAIQIAYFFLSYVFKIPILCAFGLVPSKLLRNFKLDFIFLQTSNEGSMSEKLKICEVFTILYLICIVGFILLIIKNKSEQLARAFFFAFLIFEALHNAASYFLIQTCINNQMVIFNFFSAIALIVAQIPIVIIDKILISFEGQKLNAFSHKVNGHILLLNILERVGFYLIITLGMYGKDQGMVRNVFYGGLTLIYGIRIYLNISQKYYIENLSHFLETAGTSVCLILLVLINLYEISEQHLLESNFVGLCIIVGIFTCVSFYSYIKYMNNEYLFMPIDEITSGDLIVQFLTAVYELWKNQTSTVNSYLISSYRKNHQNQCRDLNCDCRKQMKPLQQNAIFLDNYLKNTFQYLFSYTKDPNVILQILFLRLEMFHEIFSVYQKLNEIKAQSREKNISTQAGIHILGKKLEEMIHKRNSLSVSIDVIAVLNLEEKINSIEKIVLDDIKIKNHKWKYLCQSICKSTDIEEDIVQEIANIISFERIYHENKINYQKNMAFNALSLFYYGSIVFLKKEIVHIDRNLRQIMTPHKQIFIDNEKELEHNIFNQNCCLIQFDIQLTDQQTQEFQLRISNCNKNTNQVFEITKSKLINAKMQKIFPAFLWKSIKTTLTNYFSSKSFDNKVQHYYYLDGYGHVFEGLTCIKIVARNDTIQCIFFVLKKDKDNLVLVNEKGLIENVGQTYIEYFTNEFYQVPFSCLFYSPEDFSEMKFHDFQDKKRITLIDANSMKQGWMTYLENVLKYSEKQDFKTLANFQSENKNSAFSRSSLKRYHEFLKNERKELVSNKKKLVSLSSINPNSTDKEPKSSKINLSLIDVTVRFRKCNLNGVLFNKIVLEQIESKTSMDLDSKSQIRGRARSKDQNSKEQKKKQHQNTEESSHQSKICESEQHENGSVDCIEEKEISNNHSERSADQIVRSNSEFVKEKNSINSSMKTEDLIQFNNRFIEICFKLFKNPNEIDDRRLKYFSINSLVLSLIFVGLLLASYEALKMSLQEVKGIFFADGSVSDNMQLTEFMYNRALNFKLQRDNSSYLEMVRRSAKFERQYLYGLMSNDLHNFTEAITSMTKTRFYEYIRVPVIWKNSTLSSDNVEIESNQFLLFYQLLSRKVDEGIGQGTSEGLQNVQSSLHLMKMNFPELKRINHYNLFLYKQLSNRSLTLTGNLLLYLSVAHIVISIVVFVVFYRQKIFRRVQQIEGYSIYKIIPPKIIQILSNYYGKHAEENKTDTDLTKYEHFFQPNSLHLGEQRTSIKPNKTVFLTPNKSPLATWRMLFVLLSLNVFFVVFILKINELIPPIKTMMGNINDLIDSENYLFQAYFDLKANFIVDDGMKLSPQFFDGLLQNQNSSQVIFNRISIQTLTLFTSYYPNFSSEFISLLISDSCKIAADELSETEYQKCKTFFKLNFLKNGVAMAMNYFTRKVKGTIIEVKNIVSRQISLGKSPELIRSQMVERLKNDIEFKEIDESIFFVFKLFQDTQKKIYDSLEAIIVETLDTCFLMILIEMVIIGVLYPLSLILNYGQQKFELSKLYVSFLLIPTPVSQVIKIFSEKIENILQYN